MTDPGGTFKRATVTIDDESEPGAWQRELYHRAAQRGKMMCPVKAGRECIPVNGRKRFCARVAAGRCALQVTEAEPNIPPSNKPANQHGKSS